MYLLTNDVNVMFPGGDSELISVYQEFKEFTGNDDDDDENEAYNYCSRLCDDYFNDDLVNIKNDPDFKGLHAKVTGVVGRWDGTHQIIPMKYDSLIDAIKDVVYSDYEKTFTLRQVSKYEFDYVESHHDSNATHLTITVEH